MHHRFEPQTISVLRESYTFRLFGRDLAAGVITGIVALPLAIAFAIASGVRPEQGLHTAIIAGFLISLLGGSRVQIGGPTGAFIIVVYAIIQEHGMAGLTVATLMAGVMLVLLGAMRMGSMIQFIPYPVTLGFTSGIAVLIASSQIRDALGLVIEHLPAEFLPKWRALLGAIGTTNTHAVVMTAGTIAMIRIFGKITRRIPGSLIAIVLATTITYAWKLPVETIGDRMGEIRASLPPLTLPAVGAGDLSRLIPAAVTIALLGAIESLLSAVVADGMTGGKHRPNVELLAQGVANVVTPLFGGIPATGAIARTATNIRNGAKTPFAGMIHAIVLLAILLGLGPLAAQVPMAALAGVLIGVAMNMSEYHLFVRMFRAPRSDVCVMLCTFLLTVLVDLTVAIPAGFILASLLFMRRMAQVSGAQVLRGAGDNDVNERDDPFANSRLSIPENVEVYEIRGPFFFGAAHKFQDSVAMHKAKVLILRMRDVPAMDATALFALEAVIRQAGRRGTHVLISGIHPQPLSVIEKSGLVHRIGPGRIHRSIVTAIEHARELVDIPTRELTTT